MAGPAGTTSGPWRQMTLPENWDMGGPDRGSYSARCVGKGRTPIAVVYGDYNDRATLKAHAALVEAAPELYEAVVHGLRQCEILIKEHYTGSAARGLLASLNPMRAALAKASPATVASDNGTPPKTDEIKGGTKGGTP